MAGTFVATSIHARLTRPRQARGLSLAGRMSVTAPNRDRIFHFAGTDLPASLNGEGSFAALGFGIRQGRTDLRRLAAAMAALMRAAPGKPEAAARALAMHETIAQGRFRLAYHCLLYTSPSPRDGLLSRMPSSA